MRKLIAFTFVLVVFVVSFTKAINPVYASEDFWTTKTPMGAVRTGLGVAAVGARIYAIGGSAPGGDTTDTNQVYDPATDSWTSKAPMPGLRANFGAAVYEGEIYVMGGNWFVAGGVLESVWVYNPAENEWTSRASMFIARMGVQANIVNGKIYVIGGTLDEKVIVNSTMINKITDVNEVYDPATDTWAHRATIPTPVSYYASAVSGGKIYIIGGYTYTANSTSYSTINLNQIYDPQTDSWSSGAPIPKSVLANAATTTGINASRRIYLIGEGLNQVYDPKTDSWTVGAAVPNEVGRVENFGPAAVVAYNDLLFVLGGVYEGDNAQLYSPNFQYTPIGFGTPDSPTPSPTQGAHDLWSFSVVVVATACVIAVVAVAAGLLVYFKKRHKLKNA